MSRAAHKAEGSRTTPSDWRMVRLGDVARIAFSSVDKKTRSGEQPVQLCNYTDVFYNRRIHAGIDFMRATATRREYDRWRLKRGDVLFTKDSETRTEIGIAAYVAEDLPDVLCGYHLGVARPNPKRIYGAFLARLFHTPSLSRQLARIANGVTRFGLTLGATRALRLPVPPLPEQRAIAEVLDAIDDAIERTDEVISATERLREALLHELLSKGLPGWHTKWQEHPKLGTLPADWKVVRLGDISERPKYGANAPALPSDHGRPRYVRITDISEDGRLRSADARSADPNKVKGYELTNGDLLFARSGSVGRTYLYREVDGPCTYAGYLIRFQPRPDVALPQFVSEFTHSRSYMRWTRSMKRVGAQPNINASEYSDLRIPLPKLYEQEAILDVLNSVHDTIASTRVESESLATFRDSMTDALLRGRLRVRKEGPS